MMSSARSVAVFLLSLLATLSISTAVSAKIPLDPPQGRFHDTWMALMLGDQQMGYINSQYIREGDDIRIVNRTMMKLARVDAVVEVSVMESTVESIAGEPKAFTSETAMASTPTKSRGRIENGKVKVVSEMFGQEIAQEIDFPKGAKMGWGVFLEHRKHKLEPGAEITVDMYAPSQALNIALPTKVVVEKREDIEFEGRTIKAYRATTTTNLNGMDIVAVGWVDEDWEPLKQSLEVMGMTFNVIRCDKEFALKNMTPVEMFTTSLLPIGRPLDRNAKAITFKIWRNAEHPLNLPETAMQRIVAQDERSVTVRVARQDERSVKSPSGDNLADSKEFLEPSVFINSNDPNVIKMAHRAAGSQTEPFGTAAALRRTVSDEVKFVDLGTGFASAAEVCRKKVGDCTENGVLLAALGRVRGIPTRVVTGLIYVPGIAGEKHVMGFHMWTQLWINGRWVDMDAAWDQTFCDATHIALGTHSTRGGSLTSLVSGAMLQLDDIRIEVVDVEK